MKSSRIILIVGCIGFAAGSWWLLCHTPAKPEYARITLQNEQLQRDYLAQYGQTTAEEPPVKLEIRLPKGGSSQIYNTYCQLQTTQQLPLSEYEGQNAVVWTYTLEGCSTHRAELICSPDGLLLGAMLYDSTEPYYMYPVIT